MKSICRHFVVLTLFGTLVGWQAQTVDAQTEERLPAAQAAERAKDRVAERAAEQAREAAQRNAQGNPVRMHTHEPRRLQDARQRRREVMNSGRKLTESQKRQLRRNIKREIKRSSMNDNQVSPVNGGARATAREEAIVKEQAALRYRNLEGSKEKLSEEAANADRMARPLSPEDVRDEQAGNEARDNMIDMRTKMAEKIELVVANIQRTRAEIALLRDLAIEEGSRKKMQKADQMEERLNEYIAQEKKRYQIHMARYAEELGPGRYLHGPVSNNTKR